MILDKINLIIREHFSQWKNTDNFLDWLKEIPYKNSHNFLVFNIKGFYRSLKEHFVNKALHFMATYVNVSNEYKKITKMQENL